MNDNPEKSIDEQIAETERILRNLRERLAEIEMALDIRAHEIGRGTYFRDRAEELRNAIGHVKDKLDRLKAQKTP